MADPALSILIDSSGAEAGARRVVSALEQIQKSAQATIDAINKLNTSQKSGGGSSGGGRSRSDVKAHEDAEVAKTAVTKREAAKRAQVKSSANPEVSRLRSDISALNAAMSKIAAPKISTTSVRSEIKSVGREIEKLGKLDLTKMADGGAGAINKLRDRMAQLRKEMDLVAKGGSNSTRAQNLTSENFIGPRTSAQVDKIRLAEQNRVSASSPAFVGPVTPQQAAASLAAERKLAKERTDIFEAEAKKHEQIWANSEVQQKAHTRRLIKEANDAARASAQADQARRAGTAPSGSASFVGPMPQTSAQAERARQASVATSPIGPKYDAAAMRRAAQDAEALRKNLDRLNSTRVQTGPMNAGLKELQKTFSGLTDAVNMGRNALVAYGAVGVVREAVMMADGFVVLTQRIKTATESSGDFLEMNTKLFDMAQKNGVAFRNTVEVWQNLSRAAPELGASNQDMLRLTDIVQKLGVIGGSTGDELRYALRQFGQAMSMGTLRAEEMNSLLENTPEIANAIARGMGRTTGQLRSAVLEGKVLSKDVFQALMKQGDQIDDKFSRIAPSIAQGVNQIQNALSKSLGESSGGMTTELAKGMKLLAENMDTALNVAASLGVVLAGVFGGRILGSMYTGTMKAVTAQKEMAGTLSKQRQAAIEAAQGFVAYSKAQELGARSAAAAAKANAEQAGQRHLGNVATFVTSAPGSPERATAKSAMDDSHKDYLAAQKDLEIKQAAVVTATTQVTTATTQLSAAQKAATVTARAFGTIMAGLRATMAALGGPIGVAITALSVGFALYSSRSDSAAERQREFNDTLVKFIDLQRQLEKTDITASAREQALAAQRNIVAQLDNDIKAAENRIASLKGRMDFSALSGFLQALDAADQAAGFKSQDSAQKAQDFFSGTSSKEIAQMKANASVLDATANKSKYEDSFMRSIPKPPPIEIEDKASIKFKELRNDLNEQIKLQMQLNQTYRDGAAAVAVFKGQMETAAQIRAIPDDLKPGQKAEIEASIHALQSMKDITAENEAMAQLDQDLKDQGAMARAAGGAMPASRRAEAKIAARQKADELKLTPDRDPDGSMRKEIERSYLAIADKQTAGDFAGEARSTKIGLDAEMKRLDAMRQVGIARDVEMGKIDKEIELITKFGSAAGKGAQKMIEQAGAAARLRAEGELIGMAMDEQNKAVGATKLVGTGEMDGEGRNAEIAMMEKRVELEARYGDVLDENAEKIIEAVGIQKAMADQRAMGEEVRSSKVDTAGMEQQLALLREKGHLDAVEVAGLQKAIELKKQYGDTTSEAAKSLIEQAKNQERMNIALQQELALNAQRLDSQFAGKIGQTTINPDLGSEDRARQLAELQMELELRKQGIDVMNETSQARIREAGDLAAVNEYYAQHNDALARMAMQGRDSYGMLRDAAAIGLGGMEDLLVDLITKSGSAKEAFANFAKSVGASLVRMAVQMMIIRPLAGMLMGGLAGPGAVMAAPSASFVGPMPLVGGMHSGGIVGRDSPSFMRAMPITENLPKYHGGGIVGGEQKAILKRGEGVFTEQQMRALSPAGGGNNVTISPNVNVAMPQGANEQDGERFGKAISKQIESAINDQLVRQLRPGGVLNPGGFNR